MRESNIVELLTRIFVNRKRKDDFLCKIKIRQTKMFERENKYDEDVLSYKIFSLIYFQYLSA